MAVVLHYCIVLPVLHGPLCTDPFWCECLDFFAVLATRHKAAMNLLIRVFARHTLLFLLPIICFSLN